MGILWVDAADGQAVDRGWRLREDGPVACAENVLLATYPVAKTEVQTSAGLRIRKTALEPEIGFFAGHLVEHSNETANCCRRVVIAASVLE